jgi:hypothetical protein
MKILFAIVIIAIISIIGSRLTFLNRRIPMGFRNIFLTGTEYILIGVLLGGMGLNILDQEALIKLEPFLLFGLCWVGFLFGLQFEVRQLRNLPRFYFSITAIQAFITFSIVTVFIYLAFRKFSLLPESILFMASITLGSTACCTAQSSLAIVSRNYRIKNRGLLDLMRYISSVDGLFALFFFAAALCIIPGGELAGFNFIKSIKWLLLSATMGFVPALIFILLNRTKFSQQEFMVFMIGCIMFCGGLAYEIHHSPLVSGFICGIITANFCRQRLRALSSVIHAEKSIYIILLLLIGAGWIIKPDYSLILTLVYFIIRVLGKIIGTFFATRIFKPIYNVPAGLGLGLISEGGLAIAIIINFKLLYPSVGDSIVTIIIISVFVNEFISPKLILSQFDEAERVLS